MMKYDQIYNKNEKVTKVKFSKEQIETFVTLYFGDYVAHDILYFSHNIMSFEKDDFIGLTLDEIESMMERRKEEEGHYSWACGLFIE